MSPGTARDFLTAMERASRERARRLGRRNERYALERRAAMAPRPPALALSPLGFDLIGEVKFASPSVGPLASRATPTEAARRARGLARARAAALSVLTEPRRFAGAMSHLRAAAQAAHVPVMRKDFLVDPLQLLEARAAGAAGVLLVLRMLTTPRLDELLATARGLGLFVLLEAFDAGDLERAARALETPARPQVLVGVNARDLATLRVEPERHLALAHALPGGVPCVAESGIDGAEGVRRVVGAGYRMALVGSALMRAEDPATELATMLAAGRGQGAVR